MLSLIWLVAVVFGVALRGWSLSVGLGQASLWRLRWRLCALLARFGEGFCVLVWWFGVRRSVVCGFRDTLRLGGFEVGLGWTVPIVRKASVEDCMVVSKVK